MCVVYDNVVCLSVCVCLSVYVCVFSVFVLSVCACLCVSMFSVCLCCQYVFACLCVSMFSLCLCCSDEGSGARPGGRGGGGCCHGALPPGVPQRLFLPFHLGDGEGDPYCSASGTNHLSISDIPCTGPHGPVPPPRPPLTPSLLLASPLGGGMGGGGRLLGY